MKDSPKPPQWPLRFLRRWFISDLWEAIAGDLDELFQEELEIHRPSVARRRYIFNLLSFARYSRFYSRSNSKTHNKMDLISNYLKVSIRDIRKHRAYGIINIFGLLTGFTALLLILQFVLYESSFDSFYPDGDRIYRVVNDRFQNGELVQHGAITYPTIGPALKADFPEVEAYTRLTVGGRNYLNYENELFMMEDYLWADEHFLSFFDFSMVAGQGETALGESGQIVMTESFARRFLRPGEQPAELVGATIQINDWNFPCRVTGILEDIPANSHLQFNVIISYKTFIRLAGQGADDSWEWSDFYHYVKLDGDSDPILFQEKLDAFGKKYFEEGELSAASETFYLQQLSDVHLDTSLEYEYAQVTDVSIIRMTFAISLIIMMIVWINYINITTSRAMQRAREVGIRKVMGAHRKQLVGQFVTESFLLNTTGLGMAVLTVVVMQPYFNRLTGLPLGLSVLPDYQMYEMSFVVIFLALFIVSVLFVGLYPAFLLSGFQPRDVLKGKYGLKGDLVNVRKSLVIVQFAAALVLISGSIAVYRQIEFMRSQDLGMNLEQNVVLYGPDLTPFDSLYISNFDRLKSELIGTPGVASVTSSARTFGQRMSRAFNIRSSADPDQNDLTSNWISVDHNYFDHFGISLLAGRTLKEYDHHYDWNMIRTMVINEAALALLKFEDANAAIGQKVLRFEKEFTVVGVVKNFHQLSLKQSLEPILFMPAYDNGHYISIRYESGMEEQVLGQARKTFGEFYPGNYFDYFFLQDRYDQQYASDERIGNIAALLTAIAIVLAVLGLYGLVTITMMKKTKEIGIRKVLGADFIGLVQLMGREFLLLISVAIVAGLPLSYVVTIGFFEDYAYAIGVEWWVQGTAALILMLISVLTVLTQTQKISRNNPVDALQSD